MSSSKSEQKEDLQELFDKKNVLLFDGECIMCDGTVQFVIARDPKGEISFAPLQSEIGEEILSHFDIPMDMDTVVFVEKGQYYLRSTAMLHVLSHLTAPWSYLSSFLFIPLFIRDNVYRLVARYRYLIFGKQDLCTRPSGEVRSRFLAF
uniref:Thiol-disulfide oxidoreductase DCC n=1 Tax=Paramoeba aestuarina TaxID=180227 RepID=A0A7S4L845_9EUKA|mmetsp:Transcript_33132/g.51789  ORF Transcript_33132/g.51789 Transcript_33132/m.51789 type:complete len:149 (+) Transcript_33132:57-503(+)